MTIKQQIFLCLSAMIFFIACKSSSSDKLDRSDAMEVANSFIRASLDGDFVLAKQLLVQDSTNIQMFETYSDFYSKLDKLVRAEYKAANYNINELKDLNDSTMIVDYSNTYKKVPTKLTVVRQNKEWAIDFKQTTVGN